jgi:peroxiredoxin
MNAWAKEQRVDNEVSMLPDGNGTFSEGMGMLVDKSDLGFGPRSWRYSMLVRDGVIDKMFVENLETPGDPFEVSDAQTMLSALN